jgi:membrane protease YdiL (CAAX protease family)
VTGSGPLEGPSRIKAVGWAVLFLSTGFALTVLLAVAGAALSGDLTSTAASPRSLALQTVAGLVAFGFMTWALGMKGLGLTLADLRWAPARRAVQGIIVGLGLGVAPAAFAIGLSLVAGGAGFARDQGDVSAYLNQVGLTTLLLVPAALLEEMMFRGVAQVALARAFGRMPAILALSLAFAAAHLLNPNGTILGLVNIALAGVLLGLAFYLPGGIWTAWGTHLGWNATLAALDAPVSGLPFRIPLIDYLPGGPSWLTGGPFGPEGGLVATVALIVATAVAWRGGRKEPA